MVPTSLIMLVLFTAFLPASFAYLFGARERRLVTPYFVVFGGNGALMVLTLVLQVLNVRSVWLSWVLLAAAIGLAAWTVVMFRRGVAAKEGRDHATAERRARMR